VAQTISSLKDLAELIQAAAVALGVLVGGVWTYLLFVRKRLAYPRANLQLYVSHVPIIAERSRLVHVALSVRNAGDVLLRSDHAEVRLRVVVPATEGIRECADGDYDPVAQGKTEIEWPLFARREWHWDKQDFQIEPGESECLHADFLIPHDISVVELYCFIANSKKRHDNLGWTCTRLHSFEEGMEVRHMANEEQPPKSPLDEQQRQQRPQKPQQQQQTRPSDQTGKKNQHPPVSR
jgi:hypothetical protein